MTIYFYGSRGVYGCFSPFSLHGFELNGQYFKTSEHYFHFHKFIGTTYAQLILEAPTPSEAKRLGRSRLWPLRPDWEQIKEEVMYQAVLRKFESYSDIQACLLATGNQQLVENSPTNYYWGIGRTRTGLNRYGQILMRVRSCLQTQ